MDDALRMLLAPIFAEALTWAADDTVQVKEMSPFLDEAVAAVAQWLNNEASLCRGEAEHWIPESTSHISATVEAMVMEMLAYRLTPKEFSNED